MRAALLRQAVLLTFLIIDGLLIVGTTWALSTKFRLPLPQTREAPAAEGKVARSETRRILFQYRDSRPSSVRLEGDFNAWQSEPMLRGEDHLWYRTVELKPGMYRYRFVVDGQPRLDPNARLKATDDGGRPASLLRVRPGPKASDISFGASGEKAE